MVNKYSCRLFLAVFLMLILAGCSVSSGTAGTSAGKITPPPSEGSPFEGKWTVLEELGTSQEPEGVTNQWAGAGVQFAQGILAIEDTLWDQVSYKIKRVDAADYLESKYISHAGLFAEAVRKTDVITVYAAENYLGELLKIDESSMVFFVQGAGLLLKKTSDQADGMIETSMASSKDLIQKDSGKSSGVLLGLRIPGKAGYSYRTLWIAVDPHQLHPVLLSEQLFFPRTSGFWELAVQELSSEGQQGNLLTARNVTSMTLKTGDGDVNQDANQDKDKDESRDKDKAKDKDENRDKEKDKIGAGEQDGMAPAEKIIEYIGNDYIAVEKNAAGTSRLQVLPVDNLSSPAEIKLADLLGEKGLGSFLSARGQAAEALRESGAEFAEKDELGENFGLLRKNGHWFLIGRINYQNAGRPAYTDFDVRVIPPANLICYDTLTVSWYQIKDRVPDAVDAFTSPNKNIALVKTKNKLTVYRIGAERLTETPLAEIELPEAAAVIMAEWATGSYVENWGNAFLAYGARTLSSRPLRIR